MFARAERKLALTIILTRITKIYVIEVMEKLEEIRIYNYFDENDNHICVLEVMEDILTSTFG
jgi:hypothetical protein